MKRLTTPRKLQLGIVVLMLSIGIGAFYGLMRRSATAPATVAQSAEAGADAGTTERERRPEDVRANVPPSVDPPANRIPCRDLRGPARGAAMRRLALAAKLPDDAYTRYHEAVAAAMCDGDSKTINELVDSGYLSYGEAKAMQDVIASELPVHLSTQRTSEGLRFEEAWKGLRELGLCSACASDVATFYAKTPTSRCGILATRALEGDEQALEELESEPEFCRPK